MAEDKEIQAMQVISRELASLDPAEIGRVLSWARSRYGGQAPNSVGLREADAAGDNQTSQSTRWNDFASLFDAADPATENEKSLVAGYWLQVVQGADGFDAQSANNLLKHMGHEVGNITRSLTRLQDQRPALVRQVQKSGRSQQARKRYRVTVEGTRAAESMFRDSSATPHPDD